VVTRCVASKIELKARGQQRRFFLPRSRWEAEDLCGREDAAEGVGLAGVAGEVAAELHQKEPDGAPLVMGRWIWHGGI
jgi:hypothetical protein